MFAIFLLGFVLIVVVVAVLIGLATNTNHDLRVGAFGVAIVAALAFLVILGFFGNTFIANQHVGYTKLFGVVQKDSKIEPGFHLKAPWYEVEQEDTAVKTMEFSGAQNENALLEGLTADQVLMHVDLAVSWQPVSTNVSAYNLQFGTKAKYEDDVYSIIRSAVRDVLAETTWKEGAILNRAIFADHIKTAIESKSVAFYTQNGMGARAAHMIRWGAVNLRKIAPPDSIQQVNNDMAAADVKNQLQAKLKQVEDSAKAVNEARASNAIALVKVPPGMTPHEYAEVLHMMNERANVETVRDNLAAGKPITVVVGMGITPTATTPVK